jgi:hypothetical protein
MTSIDYTECWKFGYYVKGNTFATRFNLLKEEECVEYDIREAFIRYGISTLINFEFSHWDFDIQNYKKLTRPEHISLKQVLDIFNRKRI